MSTRAVSLQGRLLALVLGIVLAVGISASIASYVMALRTIDELFDAQLAQAAQTLIAVAEKGNDQVSYEPDEIAHRYQQKMLFQIWEAIGGEFKLILRSKNAPAARLPAVIDRQFSTEEWEGHPWRFYAEVDQHRDTRVIVAQSLELRHELARGIAWQNLLPFMIGLPALAAMLLLAIRSGLKPLSLLASELKRRAPNRLDPIRVDNPPTELQPVLKALDALLGKLGAALENERRFTADASHELRTPLAALLSQLQVAQRTTDDTERRMAMEKCRHCIRSMTHLVEQLLTLARVETAGRASDFESVDISPLAHEVCSELNKAATAKAVTVKVDAEPGANVHGVPELLRILLRNLLDNAIRYTAAGGEVGLKVLHDDSVVRVEIVDDGPGVPAAELELLGCRFHRIDSVTEEGAGLGLSIVGRVAHVHAATTNYGCGPGESGFKASVCFPAETAWCVI